MPAVKLVSSLAVPEGAPMLVFGNPIGTTRDVWVHQAPVLSRYFRIVRFEPRGHGAPGKQSPAPKGPYTIAELGADVLDVARRLTVIQAASHFAHYEKPGSVTDALLTHFRTTATAAGG